MAMYQNDSVGIGATRIVVGLSAIVKVTPGAYWYSDTLKITAAGGTLEIVPVPVALSGSSAAGWGLGYMLGGTEVYNIGGPAKFYLAATGATMIASLAIGFTYGATLL